MALIQGSAAANDETRKAGQKTMSQPARSSSNLNNIEFTMYIRHGKQKKTIPPLILIFFHSHLHNFSAIWHQLIPPFPKIPSAKMIKGNGCCSLALPFCQALNSYQGPNAPMVNTFPVSLHLSPAIQSILIILLAM